MPSEEHETTTRLKQIVLEDGKVTFPSWYDPNKGLRTGRVFELRCFFDVKPGHAEQLKEACLTLASNPRRAGAGPEVEEGIALIGLHDNTATLFDNDTRFLFTTTYDSEWDPYIADTARLVGIEPYYNIFKHCEGVPEGLEDNLPPVDFIKALYNGARETAIIYQRSYSNTVREIRRALKLQEAFQQVLDHPDAAQALAHPALQPLLEQASH